MNRNVNLTGGVWEVAQKGKSEAKPARQPSPDEQPGDWTVALKSGVDRFVDNAVMRRGFAAHSGDSGYQFRRDGRLVFESAPGEVAFVALRETEPPRLPVTVAVTLPIAVGDLHRDHLKALAMAIDSALGVSGVQAHVTLAHVEGWTVDGQ